MKIRSFQQIKARKGFGMSGFVKVLIGAVLIGLGHASYAQHPVDVQRKVAGAEYYDALKTYDQMSKRTATSDTVVAAGKAAWGLGLAKRAIQEFDNALQMQELDGLKRAEVLLSRGVIEFQEGHHQVAMLYAEKAVELISEPHSMRAHAWMLSGDALTALGSHGAAEQQYQKALQEIPEDELAEVHYRLGLCKVKLGKGGDARVHFEQVPLRHPRTPEAIRHLAGISLDSGEFEQAAFWLRKGREDYPDNFLDSWVDYSLLRAAVEKGDEAQVRALQEQAKKKYPPSDSWVVLLNSAAEAFLWKLHEAR